MHDSSILNRHLTEVKSLLPPTTKYLKLYQASRDGASALDFHRLCNYKGPTITLIKAENGGIFGAYADISWESPAYPFVQQLKSKGFHFNIKEDQGIIKLKSIKSHDN